MSNYLLFYYKAQITRNCLHKSFISQQNYLDHQLELTHSSDTHNKQQTLNSHVSFTFTHLLYVTPILCVDYKYIICNM